MNELREALTRTINRCIAEGAPIYTDKPAMLTFEILWYSGGEHSHAPNRVIARDKVRRRDLTAAITAACNMLKSGKGKHDGYAHGFYVRLYKEDN